MSTITENLHGISQEISNTRNRQNPFEFSVPETSLNHEITELEKQKLELAVQILSHPELHELIDEGKITYAMIRPNLELGGSTGTDEEIANQVKQRITDAGFEIIFDIPIHFKTEDADEFYANVKPRLESIQLPPEEAALGQSAWESFSNLFRRAATSVLLLYKPNATNTPQSAQEKWREVLGPTFPPQGATGSIRADFGNRINNIAHGSDSIESVHRETRWLAQKLAEISR